MCIYNYLTSLSSCGGCMCSTLLKWSPFFAQHIMCVFCICQRKSSPQHLGIWINLPLAVLNLGGWCWAGFSLQAELSEQLCHWEVTPVWSDWPFCLPCAESVICCFHLFPFLQWLSITDQTSCKAHNNSFHESLCWVAFELLYKYIGRNYCLFELIKYEEEMACTY